MTPEQHAKDNADKFVKKYIPKYMRGQEHHGGKMWTMGAYQALENMEEEVEDQWSYARQIRKCLDEIRELVDDTNLESAEFDLIDGMILIREILNRIKED